MSSVTSWHQLPRWVFGSEAYCYQFEAIKFFTPTETLEWLLHSRRAHAVRDVDYTRMFFQRLVQLAWDGALFEMVVVPMRRWRSGSGEDMEEELKRDDKPMHTPEECHGRMW